MSDQQESDVLDRNKLDLILRKIVDGQFDEDDAPELARLIGSSAENQKRYVDYLNLHGMILDLRGVPEVVTTSAIGSLANPAGLATDLTYDAPKTGTGWLSFGHLMLSIVATLLAANLYWMMLPGKPPGSLDPTRSLAAQPVVFQNSPQLVGVTACVWHADSSPSVGSQFAYGEVVDLVEGIAEFEIRNESGERARVFAEGPASIFVRSDGQLALQNGLVTAKTGDSSSSFCIFTPNGSVHFSGSSEIGIEASLIESHVHAFSGTVELNRGFGFGDSDQPVRVGPGESVCFVTIDGEVNLEYSTADKSSFGYMQSMSYDRLNLGPEYRDAVLASKPAIYWRFDGSDFIRNECSDRWNASVKGGLNWRRYGKNISAELGAKSQSSLILTDDLWPEEPLEEYSFELWVKPSHYHNGAILGLCEPDSVNHGLLLEVGAPYHEFDYHTRPNRFRFLHRSPPGRVDGESCYDEELYKIRQWQYVVARKKGNELQLFINSKLVGVEVEESALPKNLQLVVGQLDSNRMERAFFGQIDEIALYERALTDAEIKSRYNLLNSGNSKRTESNLKLDTQENEDMLPQ